MEIAGKQYKAEKGGLLKVDHIAKNEGENLEFESILLVSDEGDVEIGGPYVKGYKLKATVEAHGRDKKVVVFKYKKRKGYRKKQGHRQAFTVLRVSDIVGSTEKAKSKTAEAVNEKTVDSKAKPAKTSQVKTAGDVAEGKTKKAEPPTVESKVKKSTQVKKESSQSTQRKTTPGKTAAKKKKETSGKSAAGTSNGKKPAQKKTAKSVLKSDKAAVNKAEKKV